jgi:hypothetical protein
MQRFTNPLLAAAACAQIAAILQSHAEWFHTNAAGGSQSLRRSEIEVATSRGHLLLSCWTDTGMRSWRIRGWEWTGEKLVFQASRRMGAENPLLEFVPRVSATAIIATVNAARQARSQRLAALAAAELPNAKVEHATVSRGLRRAQPGRYALVVLRLQQLRVAVTACVATHKASDADAFISAALLWFKKVSERSRPPYIKQLWLVVEGDLKKAVLPRLSLIGQSLREIIEVFEIDEGWIELKRLEIPTRTELWRKRVARLSPLVEPPVSESSQQIVALAPQAIDVTIARHGETLRYLGLPFARVREVMGVARVWFGIDGTRRRLLAEDTLRQWANLLDDLREHRSPDASDPRHALYRTASEAWLESILRRDISRLDPGLIVAPLHAQFRTAPGGRLGVRPIDLLALRQDGRLVVIELKVFEDREHVFQGIGYWQRVEAHRRRGHIASARLFDERRISDEPPLVYLVAPTLRVHPAFATLARSISNDIELYRFDINEDWRNGVRVMRRLRAN